MVEGDCKKKKLRTMAPHSKKDRFCRVGVTFADLLMGNIHLTSQMWLNAAREKSCSP